MQAASKMGDLLAVLDKSEPLSHSIFFRVSRLSARLSGRHKLVLQQARAFLDRAMSMSPNNPTYLNELGYQLMLDEKVQRHIF